MQLNKSIYTTESKGVGNITIKVEVQHAANPPASDTPKTKVTFYSSNDKNAINNILLRAKHDYSKAFDALARE